MNGLKVQNNMSSVNALNRMNRNVAGAKKSTEKLASGFRINRAGDDAAGLGVSEKMRSLILALDMNIRNTSDGINMIDVADGAMASMHTIQQRMREIALASTNGIYTDDDREFMDLEYQALKAELDRIVNVTEFNGIKIFHQDRYLTVGAADKTFSTVSFNDNHVVNQYNDTLNFYFNGDLKTLRLDRKTYTNDELVDAINAEFARLGVDVTAEIDPVTGSLSYDANGNVFDSFSGNMMSATLPNSIISNIITPGYSNLYHEGRGGVIVNPGGQKPSDTYGDYLRDDVWTFNSSSYSSIFGTLSNGDPYPFAVSVSSPHQLIPPPAIITNLVHVPAVTPNDGTVGSGNPEYWTFTVQYNVAVHDVSMVADPDYPSTTTDVTAYIQRRNISGYINPMEIDSTNNLLIVTGPDGDPDSPYNIILPNGSHSPDAIYDFLDSWFSANSTTLEMDASLGKDRLRIQTTGQGADCKVVLPSSPALYTLYGTRSQAIADGRVNLTLNDITNIIEGINDVLEFDITVNGVTKRHSITIPGGSYDSRGLVSAINRGISAIGVKGLRANLIQINSGIEGLYDSVSLSYTQRPGQSATIDAVGGSAAYTVFYRNVQTEQLAPLRKVVVQVEPYKDDGKLNYLLGKSQETLCSYITDIPIEISLAKLKLDNSLVSPIENAFKALDELDHALKLISSKRATSGADSNALETARSYLVIKSENAISAESRIRDADMAIEIVKLTTCQILMQTSQVMLARSNDVSQSVLQFLQ